MIKKQTNAEVAAEINYEEEIKLAEEKLAKLKAEHAAKVEEEKKAKALARKADAQPVEEAINKYELAKAECDKNIKEAYELYKKTVVEANKKLAQAEKDADDKLNAWLTNHPGERFHYSYTSPDGTVKREYSYYNNRYNFDDDFRELQNYFSNFWKF